MKTIWAGLQHGLFPIFLLTVFWQTRISLFASYQPADYFIPFLYLSDCFIILFLMFEWIHNTKWLWNSFLSKPLSWRIVLGLFAVILLVPALWSIHPVSFWYRAIRIAMYGLFILWLSEFFTRYPFKRALQLVIVGVVPLVILGALEMLLSRSLGLQWIGEWSFSIHGPNISKVAVNDWVIMRPYATFPHPNVFGGVLGVLLIAGAYLVPLSQLKKFLLTTITVGLVISFSRSAWVGAGIGFLFILLHARLTQPLIMLWVKRVWLFILAGALVILLLLPRFASLKTFDSLSLTRRLLLNQVAVQMWLDFPLLGVGMMQSLARLGSYWPVASVGTYEQPIHNVPLLILAEHGVLGFAAIVVLFVWPLVRHWKAIPSYLQAMSICILCISMFDHYWWTLPAGQVLISLLLGVGFYTIKDRYVSKAQI